MDTNQVALTEGRNPWDKAEQERRARMEASYTIPTFREAAYKVHTAKVNAGQLTSPKHRANWIQVLAKHAFPEFGDMPIDEISQREVKGFLESLAIHGGKGKQGLPETARRARSRMREIFQDAI